MKTEEAGTRETGADDGGSLPLTGFSLAIVVLAGATLLIAGALLRRRARG